MHRCSSSSWWWNTVSNTAWKVCEASRVNWLLMSVWACASRREADLYLNHCCIHWSQLTRVPPIPPVQMSIVSSHSPAKKTFLGQNKSFWGALELVEKLTPEAGEITASVKDLPGLKWVSSVKYYQDFADLKSCSSCSVTCLLMLLISLV